MGISNAAFLSILLSMTKRIWSQNVTFPEYMEGRTMPNYVRIGSIASAESIPATS